ncbi:small nuclear RNA activating complex polypeptide 5 [Cricetulus griseus]
MFSRLQELRKEEETLLRLKAALHDQLNRLKVEDLALQSMISSRRGTETLSSQPAPEQLYDVSLVNSWLPDSVESHCCLAAWVSECCIPHYQVQRTLENANQIFGA